MLRLIKSPTSEEVAEKMLRTMESFGSRLERKNEKTAAEKRHLTRLRTATILGSDRVMIKRKFANR